MIKEFENFSALRSAYLSPKTIRGIYACAVRSLASFVNDAPLESITSDDLLRWVAFMINSPSRYGDRRSPRGVNAYIRAVKSVARFYVHQGTIPRDNPFRELELVKIRQAPIRFLTDDEFRAILHEEKNRTFRRIYATSYFSGLRLSDVVALRWEYVDFNRGIFVVPIVKTGRVLRVPIHPFLAKLFRRMEGERPGLRVFGPVVPSPNYTSKRFMRASRRAGVEGVTFHTLRKSFATHLALAGVGIQRIAEFLGHTSIELTNRTYSGLTAEALVGDIVKISPSFLEGNNLLM